MDLDPFPDPIFSWQRDLWRRAADNGEMRSSCRGLYLTLNSDNHQLESQGPRQTEEELRRRRVESCAIRQARVIAIYNKAQVTNTSFGPYKVEGRSVWRGGTFGRSSIRLSRLTAHHQKLAEARP